MIQGQDESGIQLTSRDMELFQYLNEEKFMVSGQIYKIFWPGLDTRAGAGRHRLTKLVEAGFVKIIEDKENKLRLFLAAENAIEALKKKGLDRDLTEISSVNHQAVRHSLKLVNVRGIFRELGRRDWRSERVIRNEDIYRGWYPDAILSLERGRVAIELENSFRAKERYVNRFRRYADDTDFVLAIFIISWRDAKGWILDLEAPQEKVCFVHYDELLAKKGEAFLENRISRLRLGNIL